MSTAAADVVIAIAAARRAVQLYPSAHPAFTEALSELESAARAAASEGPFVLNWHQGRLYQGSVVLPDDVHGLASVAEAFESRSIESLTFQPGFGRTDALGLTEVLSMRPGPDLDVESELRQRGAVAVAVSFLEDEDSEERKERDRVRQQDRALYQRLLSVLRMMSTRISAGGGADLERTNDLVASMLGRLMDDPSAMLGLATMRGASERTLFHSLNVMIYAMVLGNRLGLPEEGLTSLGTAALLHDSGKAAFEAGDPLQAERMNVMHPEVGAEILERLALDDPAPMLVAYEHHMHVDGSGFPERPAGYIAHPYSRMVAIANRYENLTNPAPGRDALTPDRAVVQVHDRVKEVPRVLERAVSAGQGFVVVGGVDGLAGSGSHRGPDHRRNVPVKGSVPWLTARQVIANMRLMAWRLRAQREREAEVTGCRCRLWFARVVEFKRRQDEAREDAVAGAFMMH